MILVAGGHVLMRMVIGFEEDGRTVEEPLKAAVSIQRGSSLSFLSLGLWRAKLYPILSPHPRERRRRSLDSSPDSFKSEFAPKCPVSNQATMKEAYH
jgi:hypothetical protein